MAKKRKAKATASTSREQSERLTSAHSDRSLRSRLVTAPRSDGVLGQNNYGKSRVRLMKVSRVGKIHTVRELDVAIALEGEFEAIHCAGDNANCLPTDTMKNTVYALGKEHPIDSIEAFAVHLGEHFVSRNECVSSARVRIAEVAWERVAVRGHAHAHTFTKGSEERQTCDVTVGKGARGAAVEGVVGGIEGLIILKSTDSAFTGYIRDEYTTLPETDDRIMATSLTAKWMFAGTGLGAGKGKKAKADQIDFAKCREAIRAALVGAFADHKSESVQHTLYAMGEAALKACASIDRIRLSMPNKHCLLVNLAPFGMANSNEIFVPTDEPFGLIEGTVERG